MLQVTFYWDDEEQVEPKVYQFNYGVHGVKQNGKRPTLAVLESEGPVDMVDPEALFQFIKNCQMCLHPKKRRITLKL